MKEEKDGWEAERKDLQCQLEEALSKAEAEATARAERAAQARKHGYSQGYVHMLDFLRKVMRIL